MSNMEHCNLVQLVFSNNVIMDEVLSYLDKKSLKACRESSRVLNETASEFLVKKRNFVINIECNVWGPGSKLPIQGKELYEMFRNGSPDLISKMHLDLYYLLLPDYLKVIEDFGSQIVGLKLSLDETAQLDLISRLLVDWCPNLKQLQLNFRGPVCEQSKLIVYIPEGTQLNLIKIAFQTGSNEDDTVNKLNFKDILLPIMAAAPNLKQIDLLGSWPANYYDLLIGMDSFSNLTEKLKSVGIKSHPYRIENGNIEDPIAAINQLTFSKSLTKVAFTCTVSSQASDIGTFLAKWGNGLKKLVITCEDPGNVAGVDSLVFPESMDKLLDFTFIAEKVFPLKSLDFLLSMKGLKNLVIGSDSTRFWDYPNARDFLDEALANSFQLNKTPHVELEKLSLLAQTKSPEKTFEFIGKAFPNLKYLAIGLDSNQYDAYDYLMEYYKALSKCTSLQEIHLEYLSEEILEDQDLEAEDCFMFLNNMPKLRRITISCRTKGGEHFSYIDMPFYDGFWKLISGNKLLKKLTFIGFEMSLQKKENFQNLMRQQGISFELIPNLGQNLSDYFNLKFDGSHKW